VLPKFSLAGETLRLRSIYGWKNSVAQYAQLVIGLRKRRLLVGTTVLLLLIPIFTMVKRPVPGSAEAHHERLAYLRANFDIWKKPATRSDYFRLSTLKHYAAGKPSLSDYIKEVEDHQLALVEMGVYERREFQLQRGLGDGAFYTNFHNAMSNSSCDPVWFIHFDDRLTNWVRITCRKLDMPSVARTIRQLDKAK
jgi:hypothetical protein